MSFLIHWRSLAFSQMQELVRDYPRLLTEFIYALRSLPTQLNQDAVEWGESRSGSHRLGYIGVLQVLVWVDEDDEVVDICRSETEA